MAGTRSNSEKLQRLLAWFKEHEVTYNEEAIQIVERTTTKAQGNIVSSGFGVIAQRDLINEEPLVVIPKAAVISPATSPLANLFDDEQLGGSLALCISVIYEMSLGADSPWAGYLQSLPENADIPLLWNDEAKAWLEGTDVGKWVEHDLSNLRDDFEQMQEVVGKYPYVFRSENGVDWSSFEQFLNVTSLVSSRAFMVDVHRDNSMVPFADIFNHKTAGENVRIEGEEMVCPLCGEAFGCEHMDGLEQNEEDEEDEEEDDHEHEHEHGGCCGGHDHGHDHGHDDDDDHDDDEWESDDDESDEEEMGEELPLLIDNDGNPVEEAEVEAGSDNEDNDPDMAEGNSDYEDMHSDDEEGEDEGEDEDKYIDTLDMVVVRPCRANNEVFNTYGEHGSSYLLHRYGFCDTGNTFDSVLLEIDDVLEAFKVAVSEDRAMAVAELFAEYPESFQSRHRAMDQDDDEEEEEHGEHEEEEDMEMDENEDGDGEEIDEEDIPMMEEEEEEEEEEEKAPPKFSIDAPGHPSLSLAVLLSLGFSDKTAFTQVTSEMQLLMHYLPLMRQFWSAFQDKLDAGASVAAAFREANKESLMKKKSVSLVCRAAYMLAEKRLSLCSDNALGAKPTDAAQLERWETAKQLRANERKTLQHCIKTYKKAVTKLN